MELREVDVDGRSVAYRVTGKGAPLVLVHGLAGSWRWWSPVLPRLARCCRVHLVDLPTLRNSSTAAELSSWLGRWVEAAALEGVDVAGHSLGGLVAAELATRRPASVHRLVLVAPAGIPCGRSVPARVVPLVGELVAIRASLPMIVADALRARPLPLIRGIAHVSRRDLRDVLPKVGVPTLLVWGDRDRLVPIRIADEWQRLLPDARLTRLPCGHVPMLEAPQELAAAMLSFLHDELGDDARYQVRPGVMDGVRLTRDDDESPSR
jgi:pimeloyl-ACP methyl ester carboxylesterase